MRWSAVALQFMKRCLIREGPMGVLVVPEGLELLAQRASRLEAQVQCANTESHTSGVFQSHSGILD